MTATVHMSDMEILNEQLSSFAGGMTSHIIKKAFEDHKIPGEDIPPIMRRKVVDTILSRIVFDKSKHYSMRQELLRSLGW